MKIMLTFLLFLSHQIYSQPVITSLNVPDSMTTVSFKYCSNPQIINSPSGPNQIWNFTILDSCSTTSGYIYYYQSSTSVVVPTSFDSANIILGTSWIDFLQINPSIYRYLGWNYNNTASVIYYNPIDILRLPITYNDSFIDTFFYTQSTPPFGGDVRGTVTILADAWGILFTGSFNIPNVLRIKTHYYSDGQLYDLSGPYQYVHENYYLYTFYSPNHRDKLVEIRTDSIGNLGSITYQDFLNPILESNTNSYFDISPNPSSGKFSITNTRNEEIEINIFNSFAKLIYRTKLESNQKEIDLTNENNGIYFCVIVNKNNSTFKRKLIKHD